MKIVVGGYIVAFPLGGMTWHHLNYLLGLHEMGHELFFLEDGGQWLLPYNPIIGRCEADSAYGRVYLQKTLRDFGLNIPWYYTLDAEDRSFGASDDELNKALADADLLICVSGVTRMRANRPRPRRTLVIDTDPVFTQLRMCDTPSLLEYYRQFDQVATFGKSIGTSSCSLPTHGFNWIPTNQPIALKHWPVTPRANDRFTTVGKWEHGDRRVEFDGETYSSSKGVEWMKLLDLPSRVPWEMTLAMQTMGDDVRRQFESHGWKWTDPEKVSIDYQAFGDFVRASAGEFTVAKQIYSGVKSGWFSDRSACYLASGKPVVTQSTGFESWLPSGEGVVSFSTIDEAAAGLRDVGERYDIHAHAARRIAGTYFDSKRVLSELLDRVM